MKSELEAIRAQQKTTWNEFSPQWKKWDDLLMTTLDPLKNEAIRLLDVENQEKVLDIASGTGEPGLSMARTMKNGRVMLTDLSEKMLEIACEHATEKNITNIDTRVCDACELPFEDNTYDAVSCRLGFMFVPDMLLAAQEMNRVLKPEGKVALSVWNVPEKNMWATIIGHTISKHLHLQPPSSDAPGLFRGAKSGLVQGILQQAGFRNTSEKEIVCSLNFENAAMYWEMVTDVTAPLAMALNKADAKLKENIKAEVIGIINQKYPNGTIPIEGSTLMVSGTKPSVA